MPTATKQRSSVSREKLSFSGSHTKTAKVAVWKELEVLRSVATRGEGASKKLGASSGKRLDKRLSKK